MDTVSLLKIKHLGLPLMVPISFDFQAPTIFSDESEQATRNKQAKRVAIVFFIALVLFVMSCSVAEAATGDSNFVSNILKSFNTQTSKWEPILRKYALIVFRWFLILDVAIMGIKVSLGREQIADALKQFCMLLLAAGFFLACINNYGEWSWNIINGLLKIAGELGASASASDSPFQTGLAIAGTIIEKVSKWSPMDSLVLLLVAGAILICFALIAARMVVIKCEAMVAMMAALIFLGFGAASMVRDYAVNVLKYVVSVAFKLFVMQLVISVGIGFIEAFKVGAGVEYQELFTILGATVVLVVLVNTLPETCSGILSGAHVGSGKGMGALTAGAVGMGVGAVMGAAGAASATSSANKLADLQGKTGIGKLGAMAGSIFSANQERRDSGRGSVSGIMKERLSQAEINSK